MNDIPAEKGYIDKIYKIHKYWARKPWYVVSSYLSKYSKIGDLVVDPFCGSGLTGCESIFLERNFYGIDLNPMSIFISNGTLKSNIDLDELKQSFHKIKDICKDEVLSLYKTDYVCPKDGNPLYQKHIVCGGPRAKLTRLYCECCSYSEETTEELNCLNNTGNGNYWVPSTLMPKKFFKDRFSYKGVSKVVDFYSKRNLYALSCILNAINTIDCKNKELLLLAFSNTVLHASKLKGENVRPMSVNSYWIPNDYIDENVWFRFEDRIKLLVSSKESFNKRAKGHNLGQYFLLNGSCLDKNNFKKADYIFTDPPYGETIQYSELSFVWNAWLGFDYDNKDEVIINPVQKKSVNKFNELLNTSLENIYEFLNNGKYFTLCFANKDFVVWRSALKKCKELGFSLVDVSTYDTYGCPYNKNWSKFSPKSDFYITFKKESNLSTPFEFDDGIISLESLAEKTIEAMRERGIDCSLDKIYDASMSFLIWNLFFNEENINIPDFDIKDFNAIVQKLINKQ